jgi:hypothetical protein
VKIRAPSKSTLAKYGLTEGEWLAILESQGGICPICLRVPPSGIWHTDHHHLRGWKRLPPAERKKHVRGVVCAFCNRNLLPYMMTAAKAERIADYLNKHDEGRPGWTRL